MNSVQSTRVAQQVMMLKGILVHHAQERNCQTVPIINLKYGKMP